MRWFAVTIASVSCGRARCFIVGCGRPLCLYLGCRRSRSRGWLAMPLRCIDALAVAFGATMHVWFCSATCAGRCLRLQRACTQPRWVFIGGTA